MKKIYLSVLYIVIIVLPVVSQELTIDQVLDKYYKANGFDYFIITYKLSDIFKALSEKLFQ